MENAITFTEAARDYELVRRNLDYLREHWREQPSLDLLAERNGLSAAHLQRLFMRWAGLSPKAFVQALTIDHARKLLRDSASVLDTSYEVGLSGPGRLHDLFVTHEGMTPGAYRARGKGLTIRYGFHDCPFGKVLLMTSHNGICGLAFADPGQEEASLLDMRSRWPDADYVLDAGVTAGPVARIFNPQRWTVEQPLRIVFIGTEFETRVWQTLLKIPMGRATTYSDIAGHLGNSKASRAVGAAVGRNPISFVVPCHRVLGKSGGLCGYHWGLTRKQAILGWEAGLLAASSKAA
ncbi:bifunctional helix-turn-helix domain-containing protein/methylated-DNA--[protein]-cysteine S-methyltransferase [Aestuariivirga sp.]|uniref:bifunctional helix-turn-helix domain-containing protein/methylated-DNA--[protein]-cysteine S-methyltransferase n=1 Tax=Aestuariivirga sp. TaxID=2650926 RepID=UPI0025BBFF26|nr:bifunctional helix-turn-helix domain-containing protein/methylated-DNA--[protein]-cysteine S-methyltransferase [Aestuariivirga sp.]MCA3554337.1 bifunctional helix-turn-helix domain-containing protein/methylated-DNA--[protein]-cysteine S-methyltransferase [Aestuariivirga sp.]